MKKKLTFCLFAVLFLFFLSVFLRDDGAGSTASSPQMTAEAQAVFSDALQETMEPLEDFDALQEPTEPLEDSDVFPEEYCISYRALVCQHPEFPTGCESAAAVSLLRYHGVSISLARFADEYLPKDSSFRLEGGSLYGPDPYEVFVGSPRDATSFGCMAPPIAEAMKKAAGDTLSVTEVRGMALETLCHRFVAEGRPVLVWVSMNMSEIKKGKEWILPNGRNFTWPAGEHCMVLVGYDKEHYILMDPEHGTLRSFPKEEVARAYESLGMQAILALPID